MKTPGIVTAASPQGISHSSSSPPCYFTVKTNISPIPSPRSSPTVGQPRPPKPSPRGPRGGPNNARPSSPNYFGLAVDPGVESRDSCFGPRESWCSPSSSVQSFTTAIPTQVPLEANPEFEAFRRQLDAARGRRGLNVGFSKGTPLPTSSTCQPQQPSPLPIRPAPGSSSLGKSASDLQQAGAIITDANRLTPVTSSGQSSSTFALTLPGPKRPGMKGVSVSNSSTSDSPGPRSTNAGDGASSGKTPGAAGSTPSSNRPQLAPRPSMGSHVPGDVLPTMITPDELRDLLEGEHGGSILLLDLRVSPQFAQSRVRGALNLCIPTTLLKRATFNLEKLQQTFHRDEDGKRFSNWRDASHLVVYDSSSYERRDAVSAMNMIKKFTSEGFSGSTCILRGGFNSFAAAHPDLVDHSAGGPSPGFSLSSKPTTGGPQPRVPPVIGGVMLPHGSIGINPFFSNIRQNHDLIDGVGQMDVGIPAGLLPSRLPKWLQEAADVEDHGKRVSDKFLDIERAEQSRMREAYSLVGPNDGQKTTDAGTPRIQLSGIEMGGKNRYKDILPFEHARVKLLGRPEGACDYVNASHLQAKRTHKRYIASQGPLPATFEVSCAMTGPRGA
jgi:hypothetical protein